jgi:hypothetical protein
MTAVSPTRTQGPETATEECRRLAGTQFTPAHAVEALVRHRAAERSKRASGGGLSRRRPPRGHGSGEAASERST